MLRRYLQKSTSWCSLSLVHFASNGHSWYWHYKSNNSTRVCQGVSHFTVFQGTSQHSPCAFFSDLSILTLEENCFQTLSTVSPWRRRSGDHPSCKEFLSAKTLSFGSPLKGCTALSGFQQLYYKLTVLWPSGLIIRVEAYTCNEFFQCIILPIMNLTRLTKFQISHLYVFAYADNWIIKTKWKAKTRYIFHNICL